MRICKIWWFFLSFPICWFFPKESKSIIFHIRQYIIKIWNNMWFNPFNKYTDSDFCVPEHRYCWDGHTNKGFRQSDCLLSWTAPLFGGCSRPADIWISPHRARREATDSVEMLRFQRPQRKLNCTALLENPPWLYSCRCYTGEILQTCLDTVVHHRWVAGCRTFSFGSWLLHHKTCFHGTISIFKL